MKKIIYFIMLLAAVSAALTLAACGKKDSSTTGSSTDIVAEIPYVGDFTCDYYAGEGFANRVARSTAFGSEDDVLIKLSFTLSPKAFKNGKRRLTIKPILSEGFYGNIVSANTSSVNDEELTAAYDVDDKKSKNCVIEFKTKFNYSNGELQIGYAYDDDEYQTTGSYALSCWQSFKFTYDKETGGYKVSGSSNKEWLSGAEQVKIPDTFDGIPITAIGGYAFSSCKKLINIVIPDTVINIGSGAFLNCGRLSSITIPYGVTNIGSSTFSGCSNLTSITIPNSVTSIEKEAFSECRNLTSITIPDSVTTIGSDVFSGCNNLKYNEYGNVKYLGDEQNPYLALIKPINNDITSVEINGATKVVCNGAFSGCSGMTSVTIPDSITSIGESTFSGCGSLTNITIPDSVTSIGDYVFSGCANLESISIPDSLKSIGKDVFDNCSSLEVKTYGNIYYLGNSKNPYVILMGVKNTFATDNSISVNKSVKIIYHGAFRRCEKLVRVDIPNSVVYIGEKVFGGCRYLENIAYGGTEAEWRKISSLSGSTDEGEITVKCKDGKVKFKIN